MNRSYKLILFIEPNMFIVESISSDFGPIDVVLDHAANKVSKQYDKIIIYDGTEKCYYVVSNKQGCLECTNIYKKSDKAFP